MRGNVLYLGVVRDRFICIGDRDIAILSPHNSAPGELLLRESAGILPIYALGYIYCVLFIVYCILCVVSIRIHSEHCIYLQIHTQALRISVERGDRARFCTTVTHSTGFDKH